MSASPERNLLFGLLALQNGFITRDQLVAAFGSWTADKRRGLDQILHEQHTFDDATGKLVAALVERHLALHGGDPLQSLAKLSSIGPSARQDLERLHDQELSLCLTQLQPVDPDKPADPFATVLQHVGQGSTGGRFVILRPHAAGGLGQVAVALDTELHREVALKEIRPEHADETAARTRFIREAEITGGLEHPGIVPVYGLGAYGDGRPYYAMKFVKGRSLKAALEEFHQKHPLPTAGDYQGVEFRQLLQRFLDVCNAMQYAHDRGVLHRDLKPGNIMLGQYGETLVIDWGLAKPLGESEQAFQQTELGEKPLIPQSSLSGSGGETQPGSAIGTPEYMSPEQAAGKLDDLGPTTDVYALGATLYHILTGQPPIKRKTGEGLGEVMQRVQHGDYPPPRDVKSQIPKALEAICRKSMSIRPQNRYTMPRDLAADLEHWLADEPVAVLAESVADRLARVGRKFRGVVTAILVASVLIATGSTFAAVMINEQRQVNATLAANNAALAEQTKGLAIEAERQRDEARLYAKEKETNALMAQRFAQQERQAKEDAFRLGDEMSELAEQKSVLLVKAQEAVEKQMEASLIAEAQRKKALASQLNAEEAQKEAEIQKRNAVAALKLAEEQREVALSALDSEKFARSRAVKQSAIAAEALASERKAREVELLAKKEAELAKIKAEHAKAESEAARAELASANDDLEKSVDELESQRSIALYARNLAEVQWRISNNNLALAQRILVETESDARGWEWRLLASQCGLDVVIESRADRVQHPDDKPPIQPPPAIAPAQRKSLFRPLATGKSPIYAIAFSPSDELMATAGGDRTIQIWNTKEWKPLRKLQGHTHEIRDLDFLPESESLVSAGKDGTVRIWDAQTGRELRKFALDSYLFYSIAISPDEKYLYASGGLTREKRSPGQPVKDLLACQGRTICWNLETSQIEFEIRDNEQIVASVSLSNDGQHLVTGSLDSQLLIWNAHTGEREQELAGHSLPITCAVFDELGQIVYSVSGPQTIPSEVDVLADDSRIVGGISFWDAQRGSRFANHKAHESTTNAVMIIPHRRRLITAGSDHSLGIWDTLTTQRLMTLTGHADQVLALASAFQGDVVASGGKDGQILIWDGRVSESVKWFQAPPIEKMIPRDDD